MFNSCEPGYRDQLLIVQKERNPSFHQGYEENKNAAATSMDLSQSNFKLAER